MLLDLSPLLRGERGDRIRVTGVCVGEPATGVDGAALTGAEDDAPDEARTYADGTVYRRGSGGELVEIPLAERVDATIHHGGLLHAGPIALRVDRGVIDAIFVRGPSLDSLGITSDDDIAQRLGDAEGHERAWGQRVHHYPSRGFAIAWSDREGRLEHVRLGADAWQEPRLGPPALLRELLDASAVLAPLRWEEPGEGSARVRYQRIASLARALGLGPVGGLIEGVFLRDAESPGRIQVLLDIAAGSPSDRPMRPHWADVVFGRLLAYRIRVHHIVRETAGVLECSIPVLAGVLAEQNRIGAQLDGRMATIDGWLCRLIDPDDRAFELRDLIAHHGWPDVDLKELEREEQL